MALGDGTEDGGGAKGRNLRWEVLDRLVRLGAGLANGQKNDWAPQSRLYFGICGANLLGDVSAVWGGV